MSTIQPATTPTSSIAAAPRSTSGSPVIQPAAAGEVSVSARLRRLGVRVGDAVRAAHSASVPF